MQIILSLFLYLTVVLYQTQIVLAWGADGHSITAALVLKLMDNKSIDYIQKISPEFKRKDNWSYGSRWADYAGRDKYPLSSKYHFAGSIMDSAHICNYNDRLSCENGQCITSALTKFTNELLECKEGVSLAEATKFLVHLIGDIHQPLHVTAAHKGGTLLIESYKKEGHNLHYIWDTLMVKDRIKEFGRRDLYVKHLLSNINNGYISIPVDLDFEETNSIGNYLTYTTMAENSNALTCDYIFNYAGKGEDFSLMDEEVFEIIDDQLASAAVAIATILETVQNTCKSSLGPRKLIKK